MKRRKLKLLSPVKATPMFGAIAGGCVGLIAGGEKNGPIGGAIGAGIGATALYMYGTWKKKRSR